MPKTALPKNEDLPDTPEIKKQQVIIRSLQLQQQDAEQKLSDLVRAFQASHGEHQWIPLTKWDANYHDILGNRYGMNVYVGKTCKLCKLFITRSPGQPHHICYKCGGKMKSNGIIPGQGSRLHCYVCENCGHEFAHT